MRRMIVTHRSALRSTASYFFDFFDFDRCPAVRGFERPGSGVGAVKMVTRFVPGSRCQEGTGGANQGEGVRWRTRFAVVEFSLC